MGSRLRQGTVSAVHGSRLTRGRARGVNGKQTRSGFCFGEERTLEGCHRFSCLQFSL